MNGLLNTLQHWQVRKDEVVQVSLATVSTVKLTDIDFSGFLVWLQRAICQLINFWLLVWYILNHGREFSGAGSQWSARSFPSAAVTLACHLLHFIAVWFILTPEIILSCLCSLFPSSLGLFDMIIHTTSCFFSRYITYEKTGTFVSFFVHLTRIHFPLKH